MTDLDYESLEVGEEYGPLSYVITAEKLDTFRKVIGDPDAAHPTIGSKDHVNVFRTRHGVAPFLPAKYEAWYQSPPEPREQITVTGRLADKYVRRGRGYLVIETVSVGADQRELVRSKVTLVVRGYKPEGER